MELVLESFRPVSADVDEVKITLAFTNLIENAIKYNKPGGWVHVTLNADHQYFYLKVEDSGIGIPEDSLEHIYERFTAWTSPIRREIGGTGLGLAITRNAVLMPRRAIKVFSTEGEEHQCPYSTELHRVVRYDSRFLVMEQKSDDEKIVFLLAFLCMLLLAGCSNGKETSKYNIEYLNKDKTGIAEMPYDASATTTDALIEEFLQP